MTSPLHAHRRCTTTRLALALASLTVPAVAGATNGYFQHGYSVKANGMAGIGIALPQDALAAAFNPAGTALIEDRFDAGLTWFSPRRSARIQGNAFGADSGYDGNGKKSFFMPEFGYRHEINDRLSWGIALYGNGGMNTEYSQNPYARFGATGETGVDLEQAFLTPSLAYRINDRHAVGIGLNLLYQHFEATGIGAFAGFSQAPDAVSNRGTDSSYGVGVRLGWTGQITPRTTVGATWSSKINASRFERYEGLFADSGDFDVPENYGIGVTFKPTASTVLATEVLRIDYSDVRSVGNPLDSLLQGVPLGANDGPGFGWKDVTVYKIGGSVALSPRFTVRGGYSHNTQPIPRSQTFLNILAPGVVQDHASLGATWTTASGNEISGYYTHAFSKTVRGSGSIPAGFPPAGFGGGEADISLSENQFGVSYAWKL